MEGSRGVQRADCVARAPVTTSNVLLEHPSKEKNQSVASTAKRWRGRGSRSVGAAARCERGGSTVRRAACGRVSAIGAVTSSKTVLFAQQTTGCRQRQGADNDRVQTTKGPRAGSVREYAATPSPHEKPSGPIRVALATQGRNQKHQVFLGCLEPPQARPQRAQIIKSVQYYLRGHEL